MTRRLLSVALLCYLGCATWMLTTRFAAWGDGVSAVVGQVVQGWTVTTALASTGDGIDFIIACGPTDSGNGMALAIAVLFFGCTPLALVASRFRRRRHLTPSAPDAGLMQMGFLLQVVSVLLSVPVAAIASVTLAESAWVMAPGAVAVAAVALTNITLGVPAIHSWRQDLAAAFGAPRTLLPLRATA